MALVAVLAAVVLCAASDAQHSSGGQSAAPAALPAGPPYTHFCRKKFLKEKEGKLFCNWSPSFGGACAAPDHGVQAIEKDAVEEKKEVGKCSKSGDVVLKVVHN
jgi:hypothetical protein